jgi:hypothetical protein
MQIISRIEAKRLGLKFYYPGKPCRHGHHSEKMVSSATCYECAKSLKRQLYATDPEPTLAKNRKWREQNRDRFLATCKAWHASNPDRTRAAKKAWKKANPDKVKASNKASRAVCKEKNRANGIAWIKANPERRRAIQRAAENKRRLQTQKQTPAWTDLKAIGAFFRNCPPGYHVDHWAPIKGLTVSGLHCEANLQYLTDAENKIKGNRFPSDDAWSVEELRAAVARTRR